MLKANSKIKKSCNKFIRYSNVAGGLISNMHIMPLIMKAHKRAAH